MPENLNETFDETQTDEKKSLHIILILIVLQKHTLKHTYF